MIIERLFLAVPQGWLRFVVVVFPDHTHLLFCNSFPDCLKQLFYDFGVYLITKIIPFFLQLFKAIWKTAANPSCVEKYEGGFALYPMKFDLV